MTIKQIVAKDNLFTDHFIFDNGVKKIKVNFPVDTGIQSAELQGTTLNLTLQNGESKQVPLADLVPAAKADKVLKRVTYDSGSKELVFTIGNGLDGDTDELRVNVADFLPVTVRADSGLEGTGIAGGELGIKVNPNGLLKVDAEGIAIDKDAFKADFRPIATIHLQDAFGEEIGYCFTESERVDS